MNKIVFKITAHQLHAINNALHFTPRVVAIAREQKVRQSILSKIIKKLAKKEIDKTPAEKPFKISLEYYEAHVLEIALIYVLEFEKSNDIQIIIDILNQQLA